MLHISKLGRSRPLAVSAAVLLTMSLPLQAQTPPQATGSPAQYSAVPVSSAQIDHAIANLDALAANILERSGIPGLAVAVVRDGVTVYARGFGLRRIDADLPVDADTAFLLASLSKPIGATVVATQVSAGVVGWDTPLVDLLPWFALSDEWVTRHLTIGDLYAHRSGLPDHAGDDLEDLGYARRQVLERLALLPLAPFRVSYAYTNFGMTAAAEGVAVAAGTDWASLSRRALYEPLGMTATSSLNAEFMARANRASSHVPVESGYAVADLRQPDAQSPAGGVSSSVNDVARWMALILEGGAPLIAADALLPAVSPQAIASPPGTMDARGGTYGYGFNVGVQPSGRVMLSHSGAFALGAGTTVSMIPSLGVGIVVLTNASPLGAAEAISATFMDEVQFGHSTRDWFAAYRPMISALMAPVGHLVGAERPETAAPPRATAAYVGTYQNTYFGPAEVIEQDGGLALVLGPNRQIELLTPWDGDAFTYLPYSENASDGSVSEVRFAAFTDEQAQEMRIEHLDEFGLGTFRR